jgi:phosphomannomutase
MSFDFNLDKMNKIILFDIDGTIAESGQKIDNEMKVILEKLSEKYALGVVGGGKYEKIKYQLDDKFEKFEHIFAECGCVYYRNGDHVYTKNLRNHEMYEYVNLLIKKALSFLSNVDYILTGHFIDLRNGIVYISLIGMVATQEEREYFLNLDREKNYRKNLLNELKEYAILLGVDDRLDILEGGSVGIGIYPKEYDKIQVLEQLQDYKKIYYFGDKYQEGGNDYKIINHKYVNGIGVDNVYSTKNLLDSLF